MSKKSVLFFLCPSNRVVKPNRWNPHGYWLRAEDTSTRQQRQREKIGPLSPKIREICLAASTRSNCWSPQKQGLPANKMGDRENLSPRVWWSSFTNKTTPLFQRMSTGCGYLRTHCVTTKSTHDLEMFIRECPSIIVVSTSLRYCCSARPPAAW